MNKSYIYQMNQNNLEQFAIQTIGKYHDADYLHMKWNKKDDNYDFTNDAISKALEIVSVSSEEYQGVCEYEKALHKKGTANVTKVKGLLRCNEDGTIYSFKGGTLGQYREKCIKAIENKNKKSIRRISMGQKYKEVELCICIYEAPYFDNESDFDFLMDTYKQSVFTKLIIITRDRLFVVNRLF